MKKQNYKPVDSKLPNVSDETGSSSEGEFNLSENRMFVRMEDLMQTAIARTGMPIFVEEDVKEFIKRDKELIIKLRTGKISEVDFWGERDKLCGEDLK